MAQAYVSASSAKIRLAQARVVNIGTAASFVLSSMALAAFRIAWIDLLFGEEVWAGIWGPP